MSVSVYIVFLLCLSLSFCLFCCIKLHMLYRQLYADDIQLYFFFLPSHFQAHISHLQNDLKEITSWMTCSLLSLDSPKTKFLLMRLKRQLSSLHNPSTLRYTPLKLLATLALNLKNIFHFRTRSLYCFNPAISAFVFLLYSSTL